jgi:hypothetical protein
VTDSDHGADEEPTPQLVQTHVLNGVDEAVEHLRAAATLGLGVRLRSYSVRDQDDADAYATYWELDVLTDHPVQEEDDVE